MFYSAEKSRWVQIFHMQPEVVSAFTESEKMGMEGTSGSQVSMPREDQALEIVSTFR